MSGGQTTTVRREGVFDLAAAQELARWLSAAGSGPIRIDLTHVREFHDLGVALLGEALSACPAPVSVHGLREHQRRLLRYLGLREDRTPAA